MSPQKRSLHPSFKITPHTLQTLSSSLLYQMVINAVASAGALVSLPWTWAAFPG